MGFNKYFKLEDIVIILEKTSKMNLENKKVSLNYLINLYYRRKVAYEKKLINEIQMLDIKTAELSVNQMKDSEINCQINMWLLRLFLLDLFNKS
jgi:hypothetical protein